MSRWRWAAVGAVSPLLAGCFGAREQEAEPLWVSLPVGSALVVVPVVLVAVVVRGLVRRARRWPPADAPDWRHGVVLLPLLAPVGGLVVVWIVLVVSTAVGFAEPGEGLLSWAETVLWATSVAGLTVVAVVALVALGAGVVRMRTGALAVLAGAAVVALGAQLRMILVTQETAPAWWALAAMVAYLLVVAVLLREARAVTPG